MFGETPIKVISVALPESQKVYVRRHNEELAQRLKTADLKSKFEDADSSTANSTQALVAAIQALVTVISK